ncbi:MAG: hypothetical protein HeimC3_19140 [Candidatus Heimdallarchaeota archaeon LC_3]|nr:MAG: hypothetical protein HeimC3_19140 [Candidatus Heimdallarchaeota archaeon LC_3]
MEVIFEEEGKYNIVLMAPTGWGAAFYSGYIPKSKKLNWGIPINSESGVWRLIAVAMDSETGETKHTSNELHLDPETLKDTKSQSVSLTNKKKMKEIVLEERISWEISEPRFDFVSLNPIVWIKGVGPKNGELIINSSSRFVETDENNVFLEPIKLSPGPQSLTLQGRTEAIDFSHEINVFYLDTSIPKGTKLKTKYIKKLEIVGVYDPDSENKGIKADINSEDNINWVFPMDESTTLNKFINITGTYGKNINKIELNDGSEISVELDKDKREFFSKVPVKIGTTEYVIKLKNQVDEIIDIVSRNLNVQINEERFPSLHVIKPKNNFVITNKDDSLILEGYTTPGSRILVNRQKFESDNNGYFNLKLSLEKLIKKDNKISLKIKSNFQIDNKHKKSKYDIARDPNMKLALYWEFSTELKGLLEEMEITTLDQLRLADIRPLINKGHHIEDLLRLVSFANLLLISKDNLSVFSTIGAFLLSKLNIQSLESIVQENPQYLLEKVNSDEEIKIELPDIIRWQRSLDDYLFDVQNTWI